MLDDHRCVDAAKSEAVAQGKPASRFHTFRADKSAIAAQRVFQTTSRMQKSFSHLDQYSDCFDDAGRGEAMAGYRLGRVQPDVRKPFAEHLANSLIFDLVAED